MTILNELIQIELAETEGMSYFFENKGVYDMATAIIDEAYEQLLANLKNTRIDHIQDNMVVYRNFLQFHLNCDCFLNDMSLDVALYVPRYGHTIDMEHSASFAHTNDLDIIPISGNTEYSQKATNALFRMRIVTQDKDTIPPDVFSYLLTHEIHHAYRWYQIATSGNEEEIEKETNRRTAYQRYRADKDADNSESVVNTVLYNTEQNEINAFATEVYAYIRSHPEINQYNFREHENNFAIKQKINSIRRNLPKFQQMTLKTNPSFWRNISDKINKFYKTNNSAAANRKWFIRRCAYAVTFMDRQYTKVLHKALADFYGPVQETCWGRGFKVSLDEMVDRLIKLSDLQDKYTKTVNC